MKPKKSKKAPKSVIEKKVLIGKRLKELRGKISQDAIAEAGGISRRHVGEIERAKTDYRIETLLSVIDGLEKQLHIGPDTLIDQVVFAPDSLETSYVDKLVQILRHGEPTGRMLAMMAIDTATGRVPQPAARSGPPGRNIRSA